MTLKLQILLFIGVALILLVNLSMIKDRKLELKYALTWIISTVLILVAVANPAILEFVASLLGIQSAMNMIFFLGFVFLLVMTFVLTVSLSRVTARVRRLAQMQALNENKINNND